MHPDEILNFWYDEAGEQRWFDVDAEFDREIARRFGAVHAAARACELYQWRSSVHGRLAEVIVLDQFSRNIFRGTAGAFASDTLALALAQEALHAGVQTQLDSEHRLFLYMPFMHSESRAIHQLAEQLFSEAGLEHNLDFERRHRAIIERFGRYPHRNAVLGRESTPEEIEFLKQPGSSF